MAEPLPIYRLVAWLRRPKPNRCRLCTAHLDDPNQRECEGEASLECWAQTSW